MTRVRIKKEQFGHRYIYGKNIIEDEGREWGDVSTSWGMTKDVSKPSETRREALNRFFFTTLIRNQPCWYLDLIFQTPELWVKKLLLFKTLSLWYFIMRALENKTQLSHRVEVVPSLFKAQQNAAWVLCTPSRWPPLHCVRDLLDPLWPGGFFVKNRMSFLF